MSAATAMGKPYTVFMDESFAEGFTVLSNDEAYFCYAALMVPKERQVDLERFWAASRRRLVTRYMQATGFEIKGEFKSGYLNKLGSSIRQDFGERLAYFLRKNDCFVVGFYTTVKNLLAFHLRTEVAKEDDAKQLPENWECRLPVIKAMLLAEKPEHPGDSYLLGPLFHQTLSICLNWLASVDTTFDVVYDPRQKKEDRFLIRHTDELLKMEAAAKQLDGVFSGVTATTASEASPGLMLADIILRDVRFLFADIPELLTEHSGTTLILPELQGYEPVFMNFNNTQLKWGDRRPMSDLLRRKLTGPSHNSMLPLYFERLADKKLSCEAINGESRILNFGLGCIEDMTD